MSDTENGYKIARAHAESFNGALDQLAAAVNDEIGEDRRWKPQGEVRVFQDLNQKFCAYQTLMRW